jgi:hypothetical protein
MGWTVINDQEEEGKNFTPLYCLDLGDDYELFASVEEKKPGIWSCEVTHDLDFTGANEWHCVRKTRRAAMTATAKKAASLLRAKIRQTNVETMSRLREETAFLTRMLKRAERAAQRKERSS